MEEELSYRLGKKLVDGVVKTTRAIISGTNKIIDYIRREPFCFSYPLLGNLSGSLQERIEHLTNGKYNAENAFYPSIITSGCAKIVLGTYLLHNYGENIQGYELGLIKIIGASAASLGISEPFIRPMVKEQYPYSNQSVGSLEGKLLSLPTELLCGVYERIKEFQGKDGK